MGKEQYVAEMYFRLEVDQLTHTRVVYTFMDFIGDMGGVSDIMLQLASWLIGSYAAFHASWATVSALYRIKLPDGNIYAKSKQNEDVSPNLYKMKLPLYTRVFLWLNTTLCGCLLKPCVKDHHQKFLDILEKGTERQEADFDLYEIIKESKQLRFELDILKEKLNASNDPIFSAVNEKAIIELEENSEAPPKVKSSINDDQGNE